MRISWIALVLVLAGHTAAAGPWCGTEGVFAPAQTTILPPAPTLALTVNDIYLANTREYKASVVRVVATIDGKAVALATTDVRTKEGLIRIIKIKSHRTGTLELTSTFKRMGYEMDTKATYTITKDAPAIETPTVTLRRDQDLRMRAYHEIGELAVLTADEPVIAWSLRWRRDAESEWRLRPLEVWIHDGKSEAHLGQSMCGQVENVPLAFLEHGIEAELTAMLPDGRSVAVELPSPLMIPDRPVSPEEAE